MQINDGEITIVKSKNYENNYFTSLVKKDKETGELVKDENGKIKRLYIKVYLADGITIEGAQKVRFKGYTAVSIKEDGTMSEYIVVQEILEYMQNNNQATQTEEFELTSDDELPF